MSPKRAACEPCRKAKLACDHSRPTCARCRHHKRTDRCVYRESPFRRNHRRASSQQPVDPPSYTRSEVSSHSPTTVTARRNVYPNPGYLGPSSHVAIFDRILADQNETSDGATIAVTPSPISTHGPSLDQNPLSRQAAEVLRQLLNTYDLTSMTSIVSFWNAGGINLALAEPLVEICAKGSNFTSLSSFRGQSWHLDFSSRLLENTLRPLEFHDSITLSSYSAQFVGEHTRWETLGIFLSAVLRATMDLPFFPSLYSTESQKHEFRGLLLQVLDSCLDLCLSLDCLNDLQLICQYENFIIHSYMNGDHSYHLWRRLGDVISTTFALGYHENIEAKPGTPPFLMELRKTAFARIYSADKNIALFLGRPLRMSKRFCYFQLPKVPLLAGYDQSSSDEQLDIREWNPHSVMSLRGETRWSALCASVKEEIIELLFDQNRSNCSERISTLRATADAQWNALPAHFQLRGSPKQANTSPFERDLMISIRLNYLHIIFLLHRLLLKSWMEPDASIVDVSQEILTIVVDAMLCRDTLVNSGTNLTWKIIIYGLPAAGILLLAMLRQVGIPGCPRVSQARVLQDLGIFVAEIERGTAVSPEEPDYALISKATQTIHRFLNASQSGERFTTIDTAAKDQEQSQETTGWTLPWEHDTWGFEIGFWQELADHPSLYNLDLPSLS
ncbi:hypothetical protein F4809DRAFT_651732 [Biscogniauxia mediterranea]|nr:hypothetical protein F4809DRAFT_651732 [Biscogniauxia mediterranea]